MMATKGYCKIPVKLRDKMHLTFRLVILNLNKAVFNVKGIVK